MVTVNDADSNRAEVGKHLLRPAAGGVRYDQVWKCELCERERVDTSMFRPLACREPTDEEPTNGKRYVASAKPRVTGSAYDNTNASECSADAESFTVGDRTYNFAEKVDASSRETLLRQDVPDEAEAVLFSVRRAYEPMSVQLLVREGDAWTPASQIPTGTACRRSLGDDVETIAIRAVNSANVDAHVGGHIRFIGRDS